MQTPRSRGPRRILRVVAFLAVVTSRLRSRFRLSAISGPRRAGPGWAGAWRYADPRRPRRAVRHPDRGAGRRDRMSVDGDPVDGYYPVTYDGISGWTAIGLLQVADGGGNGGGGGGNGGGGRNNRGVTHEVGNGGVETVTADPIYTDGARRSRRRPPSRSPGAPMAPVARATAKSRSSTSSTRPPTTTVSHARTCCG